MIVFLMMQLIVVVTLIEKVLLREPRPLMTIYPLYVTECKHTEFANPSTHTSMSFCMFVTTLHLLYRHYTIKFKKTYFLYFCIMMMLTFQVVFFVGFSRVFKAAHSYN